ncbi:hypothetical protein WJ47_06705 [Burkholderia ubonensis]|uniref:Uncharacterized protein n=2 Tax=Burkholderia ubonensis TaxID=101571 RepID=A0A3N7R9X5_9BURK|nr:hypothetical protein [Burkholderia ubonensis]KVK86556.1 hypothetical protein WJ44_36155 [Burkholderia ubonensis]KVL71302.1 hypothetical protein WJ47_06705 [Burkholderia ubonensis]KVM35986.1 hypothetical protein WJ54_35215 [Burkholderia ubonensis]KVM40056.1 hypothetical protein WJ53_01480 [Burkholderia ubonensis]KVQ96706.1 hypothetical protein WK10_21515 [Burkholderia ubonensis]
MSTNQFDEIRARAKAAGGLVQVKSIQVAYTFSGSNGPEFFQFMFNSDDGNALVNVKPTDTALLTQIGNAIAVLAQKQTVQALVENEQLRFLVTFPS